jgi:hypothetical protein
MAWLRPTNNVRARIDACTARARQSGNGTQERAPKDKKESVFCIHEARLVYSPNETKHSELLLAGSAEVFWPESNTPLAFRWSTPSLPTRMTTMHPTRGRWEGSKPHLALALPIPAATRPHPVRLR